MRIDSKSYVDMESLKNLTGGGYDNKSHSNREIWEAVKQANKSQPGGGGQIKRFGELVGIRTSDGRIDARLWENYRQFADSASDGNKQQDGESKDDGGYP